MKKIAKQIEQMYYQLKSMSVVVDEENNCIKLIGVRYCNSSNKASMAQIRYLESFDNVDYQSTSNLMKTNKWFMSACISIAKQFENTNFKVRIK